MTDFRRRRILACLSLLPSLAFARNPDSSTAAKPTIRNVGSWRVISSGTSSRAVLRRRAIRVASGSFKREDGALVAGTAEAIFGYWAARTARNGHYGFLHIIRSGDARDAEVAAIVQVDGNEVQRIALPRSVQLDLRELLGPSMSDESMPRRLRVDFETEDETITVFDASIDGLQRALLEMTTLPDYNHRVLGIRDAGDIEREVDEDKPGAGSHTGCFITTACCRWLGRGDDCFELRTLRRFRDEVMRGDADGREAMQWYYRVAPRVLAAIEQRAEQRVLTWVHAVWIVPAALAARCGLNRLAMSLYVSMMRFMVRRYAPSEALPIQPSRLAMESTR